MNYYETIRVIHPCTSRESVSFGQSESDFTTGRLPSKIAQTCCGYGLEAMLSMIDLSRTSRSARCAIFVLLFGCTRAEPPAAQVERAEKPNAPSKALISEPSSDQMPKRLQVKLVDGWSDHSSLFPDGPLATYLRYGSRNSGPLQVSIAEYKGGKSLGLSQEKLVAMARDMGERSGLSELVESDSGTCEFGQWGTAVFRSDQNRAQFWYLSDGSDVIFASYYFSHIEPVPKEVSEAAAIVMTMKLANP
jgi:hypothetical protein